MKINRFNHPLKPNQRRYQKKLISCLLYSAICGFSSASLAELQFNYDFEYATVPTVSSNAADLNGTNGQIGTWSGMVPDGLISVQEYFGNKVLVADSNSNHANAEATENWSFSAVLNESVDVSGTIIEYNFAPSRGGGNHNKDHFVAGLDSDGNELFLLHMSAGGPEGQHRRIGVVQADGSVMWDLPGATDGDDDLSVSSKTPKHHLSIALSSTGFEITLNGNGRSYTTDVIGYKTEGLTDLASIKFIGQGGSSNNNRAGFILDNFVIDAADKGNIVVPDQLSQDVTFGIDAERLWHFEDAHFNEQVYAAVSDIQSEFVRVAISAAYEREEGNINPAAYTEQILPMMQAMKQQNPDVKFFASPQPLKAVYTANEKKCTDPEPAVCFYGDVPWSPFPLWVLEFEYENEKWDEKVFHPEKLAEYYADYLNFMHDNGISIAYMDMINENSYVTSAQLEIAANSIESKLNDGVQMPLLIANSAWEFNQATDFINSAPSTYFDIAGAHNTGGPQTINEMTRFVDAANALNVDAWNTEMHNWIGPELETEIVTSEVLWDHMRAGFSAIDTWLFFGDYKGKRLHPMLLTSETLGVRGNGKYSIFKELVNDANSGNYIESSEVHRLTTASFLKDDILTVWVLNPSVDEKSTNIELINQSTTNNIEVSHWHQGIDTCERGDDGYVYSVCETVVPDTSVYSVSEATSVVGFNFAPKSLYKFRIDLSQSDTVDDEQSEKEKWKQQLKEKREALKEKKKALKEKIKAHKKSLRQKWKEWQAQLKAKWQAFWH